MTSSWLAFRRVSPRWVSSQVFGKVLFSPSGGLSPVRSLPGASPGPVDVGRNAEPEKEGQAERGGPRGSVSKCGSLVCCVRPRAGAGGLGHGCAPFGGGRCGENREIWLMSAS